MSRETPERVALPVYDSSGQRPHYFWVVNYYGRLSTDATGDCLLHKQTPSIVLPDIVVGLPRTSGVFPCSINLTLGHLLRHKRAAGDLLQLRNQGLP
jgi:hypothetical protein